MYWQGSLHVGLVGSNVETKFDNLEVSTSDSSKESPLHSAINFHLAGTQAREIKPKLPQLIVVLNDFLKNPIDS